MSKIVSLRAELAIVYSFFRNACRQDERIHLIRVSFIIEPFSSKNLVFDDFFFKVRFRKRDYVHQLLTGSHRPSIR